jgi:hypothetical protein
MAETRKFKDVIKKKPKKEDSALAAEGVSDVRKKKLKELDEFIEGVLEEAGEEFLEEFKQVEGE